MHIIPSATCVNQTAETAIKLQTRPVMTVILSITMAVLQLAFFSQGSTVVTLLMVPTSLHNAVHVPQTATSAQTTPTVTIAPSELPSPPI